ncbi:hypothetical protein [Singulisphaera sp. PoT]|uniref:hypothetical protein n=1 Tax=Singulisphaera sp. PoT TaxID=3411797 RepID=UPI003BF4F746
MSKSTLYLSTASELFTPGRYRTWKKGDVTSPLWLKRQNGTDFVRINSERDLSDFEQYLAGADERLKVESYNTFTTGTDKNGSPMMVLNEMDEYGDTTKRAIVVVPDQNLAMRAVTMIDHYCRSEI